MILQAMTNLCSLSQVVGSHNNITFILQHSLLKESVFYNINIHSIYMDILFTYNKFDEKDYRNGFSVGFAMLAGSMRGVKF